MDSAVATNGDVTNPRVRCLYAEARCCTHRDGALIRRISRSSQGVVCTRTDWGHQVAAQSSYQLFDLIRTRKSFCEKVVMWRRIMIPEKHLTLGGATSAAIALVGSLFNVIRFPSNSLTFKIQPLSHVAFQLTGTLRRQEASKQPHNTSCHLPLHLEPHLHFPRSPSQCTGNAETHVGVALVFWNK